jgi:nitrogen fixation/metabolism regulation signal transduction histidine kinase
MNQSQPLNQQPPAEDQQFKIEQACKQFYLESDRLEAAFNSLQHQFKSVQANLEGTHTKLYGKLAELDFVSHYLDAILHQISQGILFVDLNGIITTSNPAIDKILGVRGSEFLFSPFWTIFPDTIFGFSLKEALKAKECPKFMFATWILPNKKQVELEIEATFVKMGSHACPIGYCPPSQASIQGLLILIRNITEIRQLQMLANRNERLKELGELAAMVAHEIRNPLGGIKGFASLLQQDLQGQPSLQQMAALILEGVEGLSRFVTNVLNYTRSFQPKFELVDLVPFMHDMLELIKVDKSFNPHIICHLCSTSAHLVVPIDLILLKSAILNLLVNALQAMPNGGTLIVELNASSKEAILKVKDTGIGIAQENLEKIFSPCFTTKKSGNGFGLSEVHKVIQAHFGIIEVQSIVGVGTIFTIKIPLKVS